MGRLLWFVILALVVIGTAGVVYLALTDLPPPQKPVVITVPNTALGPDGD